jgi:hypothetical protein
VYVILADELLGAFLKNLDKFKSKASKISTNIP